MSVDKYEVWRGVSDLVAAEITADDESNYTTGAVFAVAGTATITKTANSSSAPVYYDNKAALAISGQGAETLTIDTSAIPLDILAHLTGQYYDENKGAIYGGGRKQKYFAVGYKTQKESSDNTSSGDVYVWRLKCLFNIPDQTNNTKNDGTDSNGQQLTCTCLETTHKFNNKLDDVTDEPQSATSVVVDTTLGLANVDNFFSTVTTPDTFNSGTSYKLTITQAAGTGLQVKRNGVGLGTNSTIYAGDRLTITVTSGTITVNSQAFFSGDIHVVTGATTVVSTAAN